MSTGRSRFPVDMWVMDSARLRIDFDEHGYTRGYDMLSARGTPILERGGGRGSMYEFPQGSTMGATGPPSISHPSCSQKGGVHPPAIGAHIQTPPPPPPPPATGS